MMNTRKRTRSQGLGDHDSQPGSSDAAATASQSLSSPESDSPDGENIEDIANYNIPEKDQENTEFHFFFTNVC